MVPSSLQHASHGRVSPPLLPACPRTPRGPPLAFVIRPTPVPPPLSPGPRGPVPRDRTLQHTSLVWTRVDKGRDGDERESAQNVFTRCAPMDGGMHLGRDGSCAGLDAQVDVSS